MRPTHRSRRTTEGPHSGLRTQEGAGRRAPLLRPLGSTWLGLGLGLGLVWARIRVRVRVRVRDARERPRQRFGACPAPQAADVDAFMPVARWIDRQTDEQEHAPPKPRPTPHIQEAAPTAESANLFGYAPTRPEES